MSRKALDQTIEFIKKLDQARSTDEVCALLLQTASRFGAQNVLAGTIPVPGANRYQQISHVVLDHWPRDWVHRYFSHGYIFRDPTIQAVVSNMSPFLWSELEPSYREDAAARRIMDEAGDFRLKAGLTVPLVTLDGDVAGFSIAGERLEISPEDRGMLSMLATYALGRSLILLEEAPRVKVSLSPREREALQWAAEGKSEWEIGVAMGISEHGVDKHMRSARFKLGTRTRTHAVAEAIRQGIID